MDLKKGCKHGECGHYAGRSKCREKVREGRCNPSQTVRVEIGLPLSDDIRGFQKLLDANGGRIPVQGW